MDQVEGTYHGSWGLLSQEESSTSDGGDDDGEGPTSGSKLACDPEVKANKGELFTPTPKLVRANSRSSMLTSSNKSKVGSVGQAASETRSLADDDMTQADVEKSGNVSTAGWISKLSLDKVMTTKVGVTCRHAKIHMDKITLTKPMEALQLKNHLQLVEWAQCLSPWGLAKATAAEVKLALEGLANQDLHYPPDVQFGLWEKLAQQKARPLQQPFEQHQVDALWQCVAPYSQDECPLEMDNLKLAAVEVDEQKKVTAWLSILVQDVVVPKILEGELQSGFLLAFTSYILAVLEKDLETELGETFVLGIATLEEVFKGLKGLLVTDPLDQLNYIKEVEVLKEQQRKSSTTAVAQVANAVASCSWYQSKLRSFLENVRALKVHSKTMKEMEAWFASHAGELAPADVKSLTTMLQDLCTLQTDVPPSTMDTLLAAAKQKVLSEWALYQRKVAEKLEPPYDVALMSNLVSEALICYPEDKQIVESQQQMSSWVVQVAGQNKLKKCMEGMAAVTILLEAFEPDMELQDLRVGITELEGMTIEEQDSKLVKDFCQKAFQWLECYIPKDLQGCQAMGDVLQLLLPWVPEQKQNHQILLATLQLQEAYQLYEGGLGSIEAMLENDKEKKLMQALLSKQKLLQSHMGSQATWKPACMVDLTRLVEKTVGLASTCLIQRSLKALTDFLTKLDDIKGGLPGGGRWDAEKVWENWDDFKKSALEILTKQNITVLKQSLADVEKVPLGMWEGKQENCWMSF